MLEIAVTILILVQLGVVLFFIFRKSSEPKEDGLASFESERGELKGKLSVAEEHLKAREKELEDLHSELNKLTAEKATSDQVASNLQGKLDDQKKDFLEMREQLTQEFKVLANQVLKENSEQFSKANNERIAGILDPIKDQFSKFEKKVTDNTNDQKEWRGQLKEQIDGLRNLNEKLSGDAQNLAKALKGDSKMQGGWGEKILERVLENSGLEKGREYKTQFSDLNEHGQIVRPDVVVFLPDEKHLIIDSKVSLTAYMDYVNDEEEENRATHVRNHLISFKNHITGLSAKSYASAKKLDTPDFVMLFVYSEAAFALALENDEQLFEYAWDKRIVIVSPTTLMATLRTIASIWKYEKQNRNVQEISKLAHSLIAKFRNFMKNFDRIEQQLEKSMDSYAEARKQLSLGNGNVLRTLDKIRDKSGDTTKLLPDGFDEEMAKAEEEGGDVKRLEDES